MTEPKKPFLRVAARVLRQLGAELITSDEIALNELVKNAFDARSPRVAIDVTAPADPRALRRVLERLARKETSVEDALTAIFASIPSSMSAKKRAELLKHFRESATSKSTLSAYIEGFLRNSFTLRISDTGAGMGSSELHEVFLVIGTPHKWVTKQKGLSGADVVLGEKGIGRLSMMRLGRYAKIQSGKKGSSERNAINFDWNDFDDPNRYLEEIEIDVQPGGAKSSQESGTSIEISGLYADWDEAKLKLFINGYVRRLQDPLADSVKPYPVDVNFNGDRQPIPGFPQWLKERARCWGGFTFAPNSKAPAALVSGIYWHGSDSKEVRNWSLRELADVLDVSEEDLKSVGPLEISFMWFNRAQFGGDLDYSVTQLRDELNTWCGGFAIYRDGFRVGQTGGMEDDWLEMDKVSLRSQGYTLNRYQTVGSLSITSKSNPELVDAANREGLVDCPQYQTLKSLIQKVVTTEIRSQIATVQEAGRKAATDESVEESIRRSHSDVKRAISTLSRVMKVLPEGPKRELTEVRNSLSKHEQTIDILDDALKQSRETRIEVLELAGIGMVVEIVVHELARLTENAEFLLAKLTKGSDDAETIKIAESLKEQFKVTNKRIRTVDALSPSGRNRKSEFDVVALVHSVASGYAGRFERHHITCNIQLNGKAAKAGLVVKMVKGLVAQVVENLVNNSVYWLQKVQTERTISIEIDSKAKAIIFSDTGPGIDPQHRNRVFRPYFSLKPKGKGLGLFIASEIANYHGGKLYLDESTGQDGRLRTFILEMPKA